MKHYLSYDAGIIVKHSPTHGVYEDLAIGDARDSQAYVTWRMAHHERRSQRRRDEFCGPPPNMMNPDGSGIGMEDYLPF